MSGHRPDLHGGIKMPTEDEKKWIAAWKRAAVALEEIHDEELREIDTASSLMMLEGMFDLALENYEPPQTSGLVEMQKYFARARR